MPSDSRSLSGAEKTALFLMSINEDEAAALLERMDSESVQEISSTMVRLGIIGTDLIDQTFLEFFEKVGKSSPVVGNIETTERLLSKVMDREQLKALMEQIRGPAGITVWDKLSNTDENVLANYLRTEYPQTVAVILSKIKPEQAARVLALLPESFTIGVLQRILSMEAVDRNVLEEIEHILRNEFMANLARTNRRDAHELVADIFNYFDSNDESRLMSLLEEKDQDSAGRIRALMFTFEDLEHLNAGAMQTLLRSINREKLGVALKGTLPILRDKFLDNMSGRAAKIMREDMESMGPVRVRDVEEAQLMIVQIAKELADREEIQLADSREEEELIY